MSGIVLELQIEDFADYPLRLNEEQLTVQGTHIFAHLNVSRFADEHGDRLDQYLDALEVVLQRSRFRIQYRLDVSAIAPSKLVVDLSRINFSEVNFENTDLTACRISDGLSLSRCLVDPSLPPLTVGPQELFRYPPVKAAKELGIQDAKDQFVLRWGLTQDARHLGQAFLWLERRYPKTELVLARLLKGLPTRPARPRPWSP
ncbi:hypothetical protein [Sulfobacillus harzensis]|uniref:Uncharacterized protein n=1 Tax=Sulfobacillus harzensis TaxID=2729629 RepID=A0A7Y0Q2G3_9FIRM|nr:hypothetical protein [Sulfobacillus harzensis]NMP22310.1 hypothetical protein [Sulfobacillus harzensis]